MEIRAIMFNFGYSRWSLMCASLAQATKC